MAGEFFHGDSREVLRQFPDSHFSAVVTDPPYELGFMGKSWDSTGVAYDVGLWREVLRTLRPGGHLLSFGGTRTYHRMAVAIEDAGFEIRDQIQWLYGTGFPKSLDISKAIDKAAGRERKVVGKYKPPEMDKPWNLANASDDRRVEVFSSPRNLDVTAPATELAAKWDGWGTALKPANEPIVVARRPLSEDTVIANIQKWGTGALNIGASRIAGAKPATVRGAGGQHGKFSNIPAQGAVPDDGLGRFPANAILDEEAGRMLDEQSGVSKSSGGVNGGKLGKRVYGKFANDGIGANAGGLGDSGGASRFFYCAKPSTRERNFGLEDGNEHPTVKPVALIKYLVRLVTPPGGIVLDPFIGSGTLGVACRQLGVDWVGIEQEAAYIPIIQGRVAAAE